jgi:hypothetical protein
MLKIGSAELAVVSAKGAAAIRSLTEKVASLTDENLALRTQLATIHRDAQVAELAHDMEEKGLNAHMTFDEKIAHLRGHSQLENVREAVKMASAGNIRIAELSDRPGMGASLDSFTSFCLTGE